MEIVILGIVGSLIIELIGLYLDNRRRIAEVRAKHFEEIKKNLRANNRGTCEYTNIYLLNFPYKFFKS